jgi:hypothetical protein
MRNGVPISFRDECGFRELVSSIGGLGHLPMAARPELGKDTRRRNLPGYRLPQAHNTAVGVDSDSIKRGTVPYLQTSTFLGRMLTIFVCSCGYQAIRICKDCGLDGHSVFCL